MATTGDWVDLAGRRPGALAHQEATRALAEHPVRHRLARLMGVHTTERAWRIGARGEELVGRQLEGLRRRDPRWHVLHSVPIGDRGSDIDHVLIGPAGAFTLNAKHHPDARITVRGDHLLLAGRSRPYIPASRHEAARAARLLTAACGSPVAVTGLVVLVGARDLVIRSAPTDVAVTTRRRLRGWLRRRPDVLDDESIAAVHAMARRSTTWRGSAGRI